MMKRKEISRSKIKAVCENYMGHYLYMTADAYEAVYNENRSTMPFSIRRFQERQKKRKVSAKIFFSFRGALSVSYTTDLKQQVDDMLGALDIVIVVLTISAGMLAFVVFV